MYVKRCGVCGHTLEQFYNTGMLGCPACYDYFQREVDSAIKEIQADIFHVGKTPRLSPEEKGLLDEYRRLIQEKEQACIDGKFSLMARLNNQIAEIQEELRERRLL